MARKVREKKDRKEKWLGELPPQHKFFLNPYSDVRFTASCPGCSKQTKQRKLPLAIHVTDWGMVILNKTCRFCPTCDLLIAHEDEIEGHLAPKQARAESRFLSGSIGCDGAYGHDFRSSGVFSFELSVAS